MIGYHDDHDLLLYHWYHSKIFRYRFASAAAGVVVEVAVMSSFAASSNCNHTRAADREDIC